MKRHMMAAGLPLFLALALGAQQTGQTAASSNAGPGGFIVGSNTSGAVMNGQPLLPGTAVLPGENVTTISGGTATLVSTGENGGVVQLGQQTQTTVVTNSAGPQVNLIQGAVQTQGTVPVETCTSMVTPQNSETIVTVSAQGCQQSGVQQVSGNSSVKSLGSAGAGSATAGSASQASLHAGQAVQVTSSSIQYVATSSNANSQFPAPSTTTSEQTNSQSH